ncbi:MAG: TrkH family potassium uptake protein [Desulfobacterales bacterium]|jgi:trk system potassium uptake protein TrkH
MSWRYILSIIGFLVLMLGAAMLLPLFVSLYYGEKGTLAMAISTAITVASGGGGWFAFKKYRSENVTPREGMAIASLGWAAVGFFGALPFWLSGTCSFIDAFFESVSGFTTTGASIYADPQGLFHGLLFWRSLIQWLGGMGIIVLSIAILPFLGVGGMQLYKAEVPSPVPDKLKPRIRETAMILWKVYLLFTLVQILMLMFGGMSLFDAVCHTFTTMPTGGFSTKTASVAHFDSVYLDTVFIVFMLIAGINFSLHYQMLLGKPLALWKDPECRFFLAVFGVMTAVVSFDVWRTVYPGIGESIRYGAFQVASIVTTTGYATADYETWPALSKLILLLAMFIGASAGSTGGGMKCLRVMLYFKFCYKELFRLVHPHAVSRVKLGGKTVPEDVMHSILGFLGLYTGLFVLSALLLAALGVDFITSFASVAACIGNIGPGLGGVGPTDNYALIPYLGKWVLIFCMLLGRLEIYTLIILVVPEFWRK